MDEQLPFQFEWDWLAPSGLSTKDFIAPSSFEFRTGKQFRMGKKYGEMCIRDSLRTTAKELDVPERRFVRFLIERRFVYRTASGNVLPYANVKNACLLYTSRCV